MTHQNQWWAERPERGFFLWRRERGLCVGVGVTVVEVPAQAPAEVTADSFFASRSGVCVYVRVGKQKFRVQFADAAANGVVTGSEREGAEEALRIARSALQRHALELAPLFAKVARSIT